MSKTTIKEIEINGEAYVRKCDVAQVEMATENYCIVRTYSAGVFAGNVTRRDGKDVDIANARRLWYWNGAASLSQMATEGVKCPGECKFSVPVPTMTVTEAIEIIPCTAAAEANIKAVKEWKK